MACHYCLISSSYLVQLFTIRQKSKIQDNSEIRQRILVLYQQNKGRDGYRRIRIKLQQEGYVISGKTVEKLYFSPMMDLANDEIISFEYGHRQTFGLVASMLKKTLVQLKETDLAIIHSDQGCLYTLERWRNMLIREDGSPYAIQNMSRRGNCYNNAAIENFFSTFKSECFYCRKYKSIEELEEAIVEYVRYYNEERIKPKLKNLSPVQYRVQYLT